MYLCSKKVLGVCVECLYEIVTSCVVHWSSVCQVPATTTTDHLSSPQARAGSSSAPVRLSSVRATGG